MRYLFILFIIFIGCDTGTNYDFKISFDEFPNQVTVKNISDKTVYYSLFNNALVQKYEAGKWVDKKFTYFGRAAYFSDPFHINVNDKRSHPINHIEANSIYRIKFFFFSDKNLMRRIHSEHLISATFTTDDNANAYYE